MNKVLPLCSFIVLILFSGCMREKGKEYIIGVSQCSDDMWRETMNREMIREASFYSETGLIIKSVKDDTEQQIHDIEELIAAGVDLLVISPNESAAITPVVEKAYRQGIPVVLVDRKIDSENFTAYVGADNYQIGQEAGTYIANLLEGKGNVVEIRGWNGSTSDVERHNGFVDVISKYPDIHLVAEKRGDFLREEAEKQMLEVIKDHTYIDLVFALNDPMAMGVFEAVSRFSGKLPYIIGIDALPGEGGGIENIRNGLIDASFIYPTGGDVVIDLAMKILTGQSYSFENVLYTAVVDKSNARIIELQNSQINDHQARLETMNSMLNQSLTQYNNQQTLFYGTIVILLLILVLFTVSILAYRSKSRANLMLEQQNAEIRHQAEILEAQKEQLISLSHRLEEATHAKLVFFTNISHEFRTPLTLILGPVETLLASKDLTTEHRHLLDMVKRNSSSLMSLISQIIEFRSFENGKMRLYLSHTDLLVFLQELNIVFSDHARRRRVSFSFETDEDLFTIWFDKEKVEKIYYNLLSNAFKHTETGGNIKVSLHKDIIDQKEYVRLEVFNSGKSIPQDKINSIFDRFYKVNAHDSGTGIGLALTSALVELHNGTIRVVSEENLGTTFTVCLPYDQPEGELSQEDVYVTGYTQNLVLTESVLENETDLSANGDDSDDRFIILLVEDNTDMRNYMRFILQSEYTVIEAEDGEKGIKKAIKYVPDIVISDVMMPFKDGFELCHILKENVSTSHIPVILLTACTLDEQKAVGFESGADAYIPKPFNAELLKIRVRKLIESRKKIKETFGLSLVNETKKATLGEIEQKFVDHFRDYVKENISNSDLNLEDIAQVLGLSRSQLYRKIKSLTNYSPNELIRIIRLKYARQLLSQQGMNISEVAYESGFSSLSYFTKCFKEFYKENPTEYIARANKAADS